MARFFPGGSYLRWLVFALICAGCASSTPSRFYQLSSLKTESAASEENPYDQRITVAIGPLRIPDYLDRPQIVTRSGKNEIILAEFDRWAGSLKADIVQVLTEDVSALMPRDRFLVIPWVSASEATGPSTYRIEVNIVRFEGAPNRSVTLRAQWTVFHNEKGLLLRGESVISEEVHGADYGSIVTALSNALAGLGRDIAHAVNSL